MLEFLLKIYEGKKDNDLNLCRNSSETATWIWDFIVATFSEEESDMPYGFSRHRLTLKRPSNMNVIFI